jgi:Fe-S cluster biosynthesis and repair protein YggX
MIQCDRLKNQAPGLDTMPFPGPLGNRIFDHISQPVWDQWTDLQTKIINEYRLDLSESEHRKLLLTQMKVFFGWEQGSQENSQLDVGSPVRAGSHDHSDDDAHGCCADEDDDSDIGCSPSHGHGQGCC